MHVLVGMADATSSTLVQWENTHFDAPVGASASVITASKSEAGIVRLVRTTCKAMCRHGSEQADVYQPFTAFLRSNEIAKNPLAPFRGNRFNILFYDAGVVYYLAPLISKFLMMFGKLLTSFCERYSLMYRYQSFLRDARL